MSLLVFIIIFAILKSAFGETNTESSTVVTNNTPPTANSPSVVVNNSDVCKTAVAGAVQTQILGISSGITVTDENCERMKLSKLLYDYNMKVAAVAILCQDERVFESMIQAGTPCPIDGKIGKEAQALWSKYDHERPDYKTYVKRMDDRKAKEKKIAEAIAKEEARLKEEELKNLKKVR